MKEPVRLVETTLRDGGYEVANQFTSEDTAVIGSALDMAGVTYIELCHSHGVGTEEWAKTFPFRPKVRATAGDREMLETARSVIRRAQYGVLYPTGPGFTPPKDLARLREFGVSFVRLALWPDDGFAVCPAYIDAAKAAGLIVSLNLMQTYSLSVKEVASGAADAARRGADWFYVVDSAGGMTPPEVREYVRAVKDASGMQVGLHAHNNMGLAIANELAAVEAGATLVDGTLQGIGRATGNAATEQLLLALQRMGHEQGIDREAIMRVGTLARALLLDRGNDATHFASGAARLHSRHVQGLVRVAIEHSREPRELLHKMGAEIEANRLISKSALAPELIERVWKGLPASSELAAQPALIEQIARGIERTSRASVTDLNETLFVRSEKRHKPTVLHLVAEAEFPYPSALLWESAEHIGATVSIPQGLTVEPSDRRPHLLFLDSALQAPAGLPLPLNRQLRAPFAAIVADAAADLAACCAEPTAATVWLADLPNPMAAMVLSRLTERAIPVAQGPVGPTGKRVVLAGPTAGPWLEQLGAADQVILVGKGEALRSVVDQARARGATVLRPLLAPAIAARVSALVAQRVIGSETVPRKLGPVSVVNLLTAPATGEVVIDSLALPTQVLDFGSQPSAEVASHVAEQRARKLLAGSGNL